LIDENHPFSNFPQKHEASLGELNPIEIKIHAFTLLKTNNLLWGDTRGLSIVSFLSI